MLDKLKMAHIEIRPARAEDREAVLIATRKDCSAAALSSAPLGPFGWAGNRRYKRWLRQKELPLTWLYQWHNHRYDLWRHLAGMGLESICVYAPDLILVHDALRGIGYEPSGIVYCTFERGLA